MCSQLAYEWKDQKCNRFRISAMNSILSRTFARVALQKACSRPHAERWKETPLTGVIERNMFLWGRISSSKYLVEVIRALSALCPVLAFIVAGYVVHSFPGAWFSSSLDSLLFSSFYSV